MLQVYLYKSSTITRYLGRQSEKCSRIARPNRRNFTPWFRRIFGSFHSSNNIPVSDGISLFYKHLSINNTLTFRRKMTENKKTTLALRCHHAQCLCHDNSAVPMLRQLSETMKMTTTIANNSGNNLINRSGTKASKYCIALTSARVEW